MSLIFGVVHFKENNVDPFLTKITEGFKSLRADRIGFWSDKNVGLGNVLRYNTPESIYEKMPFRLNQYTITAYCRIDNRLELFRLLDLHVGFQKETPDSYVILKAYQKWGENCVNYLKGDWSFAIWDVIEKKLFISTDCNATSPIYYYKSDDFFVFSSSIHGILGLEEIVKVPNDKFLAGVLVRHKLEGNQTAYANIFSVLPATILLFQNNHLAEKKYWSPRNISLLYLKSVDDYLENFLELYSNSIKNRLRSYGKVGSMLSGGLDSGSVSAMAARELKAENKTLLTYTSIPKYDVRGVYNSETRFADESDYAKSIAQFSGNIDLNFVKGDSFSMLESVEKSLDIFGVPIHNIANVTWILDLLEKAQKDGVKTLFTGQGGNITISWHGIPPPETVFSLLKKYHADKIKLIGLLKEFSKLILYGHNRSNVLKMDSVISSSLLKITDVQDLKEEYFSRLGKKSSNFSFEKRCNLMNPLNNSDGLWQEIGHAYDMNILDPTRDKSLTEFCLSIPDSFYRNEETNRLIIRRSMQSILPENVRLNRRKGLQFADSQFRLKKEYLKFKEVLNDFEELPFLSDYLDLKKMKFFLEKIYNDIDGPEKLNYVAPFMRGVGVGIHLKKIML